MGSESFKCHWFPTSCKPSCLGGTISGPGNTQASWPHPDLRKPSHQLGSALQPPAGQSPGQPRLSWLTGCGRVCTGAVPRSPVPGPRTGPGESRAQRSSIPDGICSWQDNKEVAMAAMSHTPAPSRAGLQTSVVWLCGLPGADFRPSTLSAGAGCGVKVTLR